MSRGRHRRTRTHPTARRVVTLALPVAVVAAAPVSVAAWPDGSGETPAEAATTAGDVPERRAPLSRSATNRPAPHPTTSPTVSLSTPERTPEATPTDTPTPEPTVVDHMYATVGLNVRSGPGQHTEVLGVLASGTKIGVTGESDGSWVQVVYDDQAAWVSGDYLSAKKPAAEAAPQEAAPTQSSGGISYAECATGSAVESGLTSDAIRVHRAVCAQFPQVTTYLGLRSGGGAHGEGRALDIMVYSDSSLGDAIAAWVRDNHKALGVSEVIWSQRIWTVERSSEGWRWMEDRGSATANHYDHVHVTVYGSAAG